MSDAHFHLTDEEIMEDALMDFAYYAKDKFMKGIKEHNSDGTKGLSRMSTQNLIKSIKDEIIDSWFYVSELERRVK